LRATWSLALFAAAAAPLGLLAALSLPIQKRGLEDAERELQAAVTDDAARTIGASMAESSEIAQRIAEILTEGRIADDDVRLTLAKEQVARPSARAIDYVSVYGVSGDLIDTLVRGDVERPPSPPAHVEPRERGAWLAGGGSDVFFLQPMVRDGERRGFLVASLSRDALSAEIDALSEARFRQRGRVTVIDADTRVVAGPQTGDWGVGKMVKRDAVAPSGRPAPGLAATALYVDEEGAAMIGTVRSLPELGWQVLARRPERDVLAAYHRTRALLLGAAAGVGVLALVLGALFARRITRPIAELAELTRAYARRDWKARSTIRTGDELELLGGSLSGMADALEKSEVEIARRAAVEAGLARYLPAEVAKRIASGEGELALAGERRRVTVVFADVARFTTFAEQAAPEDVTRFLNELFTVLSEVVFRHGGMIDKFIGDCVMAVFGAFDEDDHAARAMRAAEDMHRFVEASAPAWAKTFAFDVKLGIGVSTGEAVIGNLGSDARMEYTAIGDVVNVASRLEALAQPGQTLATADASAAAGGEFSFRALGARPLRGKKEPVEIVAVVP